MDIAWNKGEYNYRSILREKIDFLIKVFSPKCNSSDFQGRVTYHMLVTNPRAHKNMFAKYLVKTKYPRSCIF